MNRIRMLGCAIVVTFAAGVAVPGLSVQAQLHNGAVTILLEGTNNIPGASMGVTYASDSQIYYTGGGLQGWMTSNNADGSIHQAILIHTNARAWNYNPHTGNLEMITGNAWQGNGVDSGYFHMIRDPQGFIDGSKVDILPSLPGLNGPESCPFYDAQANVFYSAKAGSNVVNVVSAVDGSLLSQIHCTGAPAITDNYGIGYDADRHWLMLYSSTLEGVMVFDSRTGQYIGLAFTNYASTDGFGFAYANKQVWLFDPSRPGWLGFDIGANGGSGGTYSLTVTGSCPGTIQLSWNDATPNARQVVALGTQQGTFVIPMGMPCAGTILGLAGDVKQVGGVIDTGMYGSGTVSAMSRTAVCGDFLQLLELGSCRTSSEGLIP